MHPRCAIVTDSTASLPRAVTARLGVRVVPAQVHIGRYTTDEDQVDRANLIAAMQSELPVATAPPAVERLLDSYEDAEFSGAHEVVSIHISSRLSQTCESARDAAASSRLPVHVVDSLTTGLGLGFLVIAAGNAALAGATAEEIVHLLRTQPVSEQLIYVDTLEHLRRGGRIGGAAAWLGTAFSIKPLLGIVNGTITPVARIRGTERALNRLVDTGVERAKGRPVDIGVEHVAVPERADELAARLRRKLPRVRESIVTPASAVLAAHLGPGAVAVALSLA